MKKIIEDLKGVNKATWVRTVLLALGIINYFLNAFGIQTIAFDNDQVTELVNAVYITVTGFLALYKNNNFSAEAREAQHYLDAMKAIKNKEVQAPAVEVTESDDDDVVMG